MTTTTTQPKIELKNIKYAAFASEETHCYEATLYVDGKRFGTVSNDGQGGADSVTPFAGKYSQVTELEERIRTTYPERDCFGTMLPESLESLCCDLVNQWHRTREAKKILKRVSYTKEGQKGIFQLAAKFKPTPETIAAVKAKAPWAKNCTFLADLPEADAIKLILENLE